MAYSDDILRAALTDNLPWERLSGKNILVTGATGLIGGCLVEILMSRPGQDYHVYASGRNEARVKDVFSQFSNSPWFHFIRYDVTEPMHSDLDFHFIIAAASGANPVLYSTDPIGVMKANFIGADCLLQYGAKHRMEKFVYISSGDVYGEGDGRIFTEDYSGYVDNLALRSCYSSSKRATETLCVAYAMQMGVDISIARPCHTFGPHFTDTDTRAYAQFIKNVVNNEDIVMKSKGDQVRSWCYVVDCALGILFVALKGENCEAYNIADEGACLSIRELAELIAAAGNRQLRFQLPDEIEKKGFNPATRSVFSSEKLQKTGWRVENSIQEKIRNTLFERKH